TASALERLLTDDGLSARFGVAGRARAEELFDLEKTAGALARLFRRHLGLLRHAFRKRPAKVRDKNFDIVRFVGGAEGDA
ncbi:MAG: glycosyltransferase family 4 protein, partial [Akkermansiaceae bacterium]|nr:glycosyltransferase family 4 protein [Akkermansiaceae bacterium]